MVSRGAQAKQPKNGTYGGVEDARVTIAVSTWEVHSLVGLAIAVTTDLDLCARGVELGSALTLGKMKGNNLVSYKIITRLQSLRQHEGIAPAFLCQQ